MFYNDPKKREYINKETISAVAMVDPLLLFQSEDAVRVAVQASLAQAPHLKDNAETWTTLLSCQLRALMTRD